MTPAVVPYADILTEIGGLIAGAGLFARFIVLLLFVLSVISWMVMIERAVRVKRAEKANRAFWHRFDEAREGRIGMAELAEWCRSQVGAPLARLFVYFSQEYWPLYQERRGGDDRLLLGMLARGIDRESAAELGRQERGLGWLATLSAVAPFLGLLGTVWGIMNSFLQLGRQGSATLDVVGPGIAEALITTVCGLAVAIPAVVGFNYFTRRLQAQQTEMARLGSLLADVVAEEELSSETVPQHAVR